MSAVLDATESEAGLVLGQGEADFINSRLSELETPEAGAGSANDSAGRAAENGEGSEAGAADTGAAEDAPPVINREKKNAEGESQADGTEAQRKRDAEGKFTKQDGAPADGKVEEKKSRIAREQERREKSWEKLKAEREALEAERAEFQRQKATMESKPIQAQDVQEKFTAEQYEAAAEKWEKAGNFEWAEAARKRAEELKAVAKAGGGQSQISHLRSQSAAPGTQDPQFVSRQLAVWQQVKTGMPEFFSNPQLNGQLQAFIKENPRILEEVNGPLLAAQFVKARAAEEFVPKLKTRVAELEAEVKRLTGLTSLNGGGGSAGPGPAAKSFEQMSTAEQEAQLARDLGR